MVAQQNTPCIGTVKALVSRALDQVEDLMEDAQCMPRMGFCSRLLGKEAMEKLGEVRRVADGHPDADLELNCAALPALLQGACHVPDASPGGVAVLGAAHDLADAAVRVLAALPMTPAAEISGLQAALSRYPQIGAIS